MSIPTSISTLNILSKLSYLHRDGAVIVQVLRLDKQHGKRHTSHIHIRSNVYICVPYHITTDIVLFISNHSAKLVNAKSTQQIQTIIIHEKYIISTHIHIVSTFLVYDFHTLIFDAIAT